MPRNVTSDYILALNSGSMYPCIFVEIYFASGPVRLCTAMYDTLLSISVNLESALLDMNTPVPYRWTAETQAIFFPKDKGFRFVTSIQNVPTYWNQVESNNGTP
jgi:hypothetical protein